MQETWCERRVVGKNDAFDLGTPLKFPGVVRANHSGVDSDLNQDFVKNHGSISG
jgi:hypothetical protein